MKRWLYTAVLWVVTAALLLSAMPIAASETLTPYYGDVNGDGDVATADVRLILRQLVGNGTLARPERADYDEDGTVDSTDARLVLLSLVSDEPLKLYLSAADYSGDPYIVLEHNVPRFDEEDKQVTDAFEEYDPLDELGRCTVAYANIAKELMPTEERGSLSSVTPTGWHNNRYDCVSGGWLYNRSHMIGFQLTGEQANPRNLITGTRYLNVEGMLPFENEVAAYVEDTDGHVLYRVTPIFRGDNLLAEGVTIEAWSMEDGGEAISIFVFCYNVQDGVVLDYATGENRAADSVPDNQPTVVTFILNISTKKFHLTTCRYVASIAEENYQEYGGTRDELVVDGYTPCGICKP